MEKVCKKHQINPALIYGQCIGCELESLHNSVEVANLHRQNENLERRRAERERDEARQANAALLELAKWIDGYRENHLTAHAETYEYAEAFFQAEDRARYLLTQYDTAPKEDKANEYGLDLRKMQK